MQINWAEFFSWDFWFEVERARLHFTDKAFLVVSGVAIVIAIGLLIYRAKQKNPFLRKPISSFIHILFTVGFLELLWFGAKYQNAAVISSRIVALVIIFACAIWALWPLKYLLGKFKEDQISYQRQLQKEKYLK